MDTAPATATATLRLLRRYQKQLSVSSAVSTAAGNNGCNPLILVYFVVYNKYLLATILSSELNLLIYYLPDSLVKLI
ncbi:hypothetical protein M5689_022017 [Euphorbia peplus]|nr:hypothetical protein M5689_022017 [Euphorbia peplus]